MINSSVKSSKLHSNVNSKLEEVIEFKLPIEESNRCLIKIVKNNSTPKLFPRKYNEIKNLICILF